MYQPFKITTVKSDFKNKRIVAYASHDILPESINDSNIQVYEKSSRNFLELQFEVDGKKLYINFYDWPIPNENYILKIGTILNILEEESESNIRRQIIFDSNIKNTVKIVSPSMYESLENVHVRWEEISLDEEQTLNEKYYLEVSTDNSFYNIVTKSHITNKQDFLLEGLSESQYYLRCRVEDGNDYGKWSDIVTFNITSLQISKPEDNEDSMTPIIEKDLNIVNLPPNGTTPNSIIIKFDEMIDSDSTISISRRDI